MEEAILQYITEHKIIPLYIITPIIIGMLLFKYIIPFIIRIYSCISQHFLKISKLLDTAEQFKNNGGSTLRDKIDLIDEHVCLLLDKVYIINSKIYNLCFFIGEMDSGAAVFETDKDGKCTFITGKWHELTGLMPEEAYGNGWIQGVYEQDRQLVYEAWTQCITQNREFILTYRMYNPIVDKITKVRCRAKKVINSKEEVVKYIGAVYAINEVEF